jgi:hypothetical protein
MRLELVHTGPMNDGELLEPRVTGSGGGLHKNKPTGEGVLWTSPRNSSASWSHHLASDKTGEFNGAVRWWIDLSEEALVAVVDSMEDLIELARRFPSSDCVLDWELLCCEYDAFWLTQRGLLETAFGDHHEPNMVGWDCESVVVFNNFLVDKAFASMFRHQDSEYR